MSPTLAPPSMRVSLLVMLLSPCEMVTAKCG